MSLVSIVIPTYKRPHLIGEAIKNCLEQSYPFKEIIIVDDNGLNTKNQISTYEIYKSLDKNHPKATLSYYALMENSGACVARNKGIELSKGNFVAFYDDDDRWARNKISQQVKVLNSQSEIDIAVCGAHIIKNGKRKQFFPYLPPVNQYEFFLDNINQNFGLQFVLFRTTVFQKYKLTPTLPAAQDLEFNLRILSDHKAQFIREPLVSIFRDEPSRISSQLSKKITGFEYILKRFSTILGPNSIRYLHHRLFYLNFRLGNYENLKFHYGVLRQKSRNKWKYQMYMNISKFPLVEKAVVKYLNKKSE